MSLAPQRPNFVLIWIGIVMLTFSVGGKWLLDLASGISSTAENQARLYLDTEDFSILPDFPLPSTGDLALLPAPMEAVFDQLVPLREDPTLPDDLLAGLKGHEESVLAGVLAAKSSAKVTPEAAEETLDPGLVHPIEEDQPEQQKFHALHLAQTLQGERHDGNARSSTEWHPSRGGNDAGRLAVAARKAKGSGKDVVVKTTLVPLAKGRVSIHFLLTHAQSLKPNQGRVEGLLSERRDLDPHLALRAAEILHALEEVVEADESSLEEERERIRRMQKKLLQYLQQRPGGVELMAELSPRQLEQLLQKLSVRNPEFRALLQG